MRVQLGDYTCSWGTETYRWDGEEPLAVGDWVVAPATPFCGPTVKFVSAVGDDLGANYEDDELRPITGKLTRDGTTTFSRPPSGSATSTKETTK